MKLLISIVTLLVISIPSQLKGQAFSTFNNRNHPEIEWFESETPHFRIIYAKHLQKWIPDAVAVAESTYVSLSASLNVEFDRKIKIYFSDEDEIVNGAATPFLGSYTYIWVGLNDSPDFFTGDKKWIRTVLAHELAHLFHFEAVKSNMGIWGLVLGDGIPRDVTEGYAQYATEKWNAQRGDRWLRSAIFDDKPSFNDGSPYNGRLLYADGYSKLLFISDQYGDSTISKMFAYRDTLFLGLTYPNIYKGFKKATGEKWTDFDNRRSKHLNIYYNTMASQMDRTDSLKGEKIELDQQLYLDAKASPDGQFLALSVLESMRKPIYKTILLKKDSTKFSSGKILFKGSISPDLSWSKDGKTLYFSKINRARNGSLEYDIYRYSLLNKKEDRLSFGLRLISPIEENEDVLLAIQNQNGTGNVIRFFPKTKKIEQITSFKTDIQLLHLAADSSRNQIAFLKVDEKGSRTIEVMNLSTKESFSLTSGETDDRNPKFSPDGKKMAFTSLRDNVPNIFVVDLDTKEIERATFVFTGAELNDWPVKDSTGKANWIVNSTEKKEFGGLWIVSDSLRTSKETVHIPEAYSSWTSASPEIVIGGNIPPKNEFIVSTKPYSHLKNVGHFLSFGFPYQDNTTNDYGFQGLSNWTDPLGKHMFSLFGNMSFTKLDNTYGLFSYMNNTQSFSWGLDAYRFPSAFQFYNDNSLLSLLSGFSVSVTKQFDWPYKPYTQSKITIMNRNFMWEASGGSIYSNGTDLDFPKRWQNDLSVTWIYKYLLPYAHNDVHPLRAYGTSLTLKAGIHAQDAWLGDDKTQFGIIDFRFYDVRQVWGETTFYTSFRMQIQFKEPLPFEAVQLARYDNFSLPIFEGMPVAIWNIQDRVRGYRTFILADQLYFNTLEYRVPILPTLATKVLGFISLDKTTFALFSDVAYAANTTFYAGKFDGGVLPENRWQWGIGAELKNKVTLLGLPIVQSLGLAQPHNQLFKSDYDLYYRVQATIPF